MPAKKKTKGKKRSARAKRSNENTFENAEPSPPHSDAGSDSSSSKGTAASQALEPDAAEKSESATRVAIAMHARRLASPTELRSHVKIYWSGSAMASNPGNASTLATLEQLTQGTALSSIQSQFAFHVPATWEEAKRVIDGEREKPTEERDMFKAIAFMENVQMWGSAKLAVRQTHSKITYPLEEGTGLTLPAADLPPTVFNRSHRDSNENRGHSSVTRYHFPVWTPRRQLGCDALIAMSYWVSATALEAAAALG